MGNIMAWELLWVTAIWRDTYMGCNHMAEQIHEMYIFGRGPPVHTRGPAF